MKNSVDKGESILYIEFSVISMWKFHSARVTISYNNDIIFLSSKEPVRAAMYLCVAAPLPYHQSWRIGFIQLYV